MTALRSVRTAHLALLLGLAGVLASGLRPLEAAGPYSDDALKAAYLYRFAGYVEWPPEVQTSSVFTIAVLGDEDVAAQLQRLLPGHLIKGHPAQVRLVHSLRDLEGVQVLYVGAAYSGSHRVAIASIETRPILIVTDEEDGLEEGSVINFVESEQRVRFEVSLVAAERLHLTISSQLLSVAARVQGGRLHTEASCISGAGAGWSDSRCTHRVAHR